jgi:pyruvate kinase
MCRPSEPIKLEAGQTVLLTCDSSKQASSSVLPIAYPTLAGTGILPGRSVFVGQYLFTGEQPYQQ